MVKIIAIDGPSGSGKGTLAAMLARHYGFRLLDSGAIYRLLGLKLLKQNLLNEIEKQLQSCIYIAEHLDIEFKSTDEGLKVFLDGQDVSKEIRSETVGNYASKVAAIPELRQALLQRQRDFAQEPGLVADGRDMGTLVFPNAPVKIFLTATSQSRAQRRVKQLQNMGIAVNIERVLADIQERDLRDTQRKVAPLKAAEDAKIIDSSELDIDEVFKEMVDYIDAIF